MMTWVTAPATVTVVHGDHACEWYVLAINPDGTIDYTT